MFKVYSKDTRTTPMVSFWYLYCELGTYFTPCSSVSIVNSEQVAYKNSSLNALLSLIFYVFYSILPLNPLSANFTKWSNTHKASKLPTNCLSVFDHFVGLTLKGLTLTLFFKLKKRNCTYVKD